MKELNVNYPDKNLDFNKASGYAATFAENSEDLIEPVMIAWHDKKASRMSPVIEGGDINTRWHDYGESHGGKLAIDVNGDFDFIFAESCAFDTYGPSPYVNLHDKLGHEYLCLIKGLRDPHNPLNPSKEACVALDEWTSKQT